MLRPGDIRRCQQLADTSANDVGHAGRIPCRKVREIMTPAHLVWGVGHVSVTSCRLGRFGSTELRTGSAAPYGNTCHLRLLISKDLAQSKWRKIQPTQPRPRCALGKIPTTWISHKHPWFVNTWRTARSVSKTEAGRKCNRRLSIILETLAPQLPIVSDMGPAFLGCALCGRAVTCEALHEI